jgi:hypothetical protein
MHCCGVTASQELESQAEDQPDVALPRFPLLWLTNFVSSAKLQLVQNAGVQAAQPTCSPIKLKAAQASPRARTHKTKAWHEIHLSDNDSSGCEAGLFGGL